MDLPYPHILCLSFFYELEATMKISRFEKTLQFPASIEGVQPIRLSNGEAVLNKEAVELVGEDFVHRVNAGGLAMLEKKKVPAETVLVVCPCWLEKEDCNNGFRGIRRRAGRREAIAAPPLCPDSRTKAC